MTFAPSLECALSQLKEVVAELRELHSEDIAEAVAGLREKDDALCASFSDQQLYDMAVVELCDENQVAVSFDRRELRRAARLIR